MIDDSSCNSDVRLTITIDADLEEIVPGFLDNRRRDVATLQTAMAANDLATIRLLGHRMKGDGGGYGFDRISEIGDALEHAAMRADLLAVARETTRLADFLARVDVVYKR
ncbi:MAG TPA: Hpt domain-containing protein [Nitrospira sp.]|nr:Hpt domain-containing protein [Nitrospira sp.]